jgi:hypothetical protein
LYNFFHKEQIRLMGQKKPGRATEALRMLIKNNQRIVSKDRAVED